MSLGPANGGVLKVQEKEQLPFSIATAEAAVAECKKWVAKNLPDVTFVGKFRIAKRRPGATAFVENTLEGRSEDVYAVYAPQTNPAMFGATNRGYSGCSFHATKDGKLEFHKFQNSSSFPRYRKLEPGEK